MGWVFRPEKYPLIQTQSPQGAGYFSEINGDYSGTKGFEDAYGEDFVRKRAIKIMASFGLPVRIYTHRDHVQEDAWAEKEFGVTVVDIDKGTLACAKEAMWLAGFSPTASLTDAEYDRIYHSLSPKKMDLLTFTFGRLYAETFGTRAEQPTGLQGLYSFDAAEAIIWANHSPHYAYDENRFLVVNPYFIEAATINKFISKMFFHPHASPTLDVLLSRFHSDNERLQKFLRENEDEKFVLKPAFGKCGTGVVVLERRDLVNAQRRLRKELPEYLSQPEKHFEDQGLVEQLQRLRLEKGFLLEPFVESRPFLSPQSSPCIIWEVMCV